MVVGGVFTRKIKPPKQPPKLTGRYYTIIRNFFAFTENSKELSSLITLGDETDNTVPEGAIWLTTMYSYVKLNFKAGLFSSTFTDFAIFYAKIPF